MDAPAPQTHRVVLVRPWTDVHGGGGCCSGGSGGAVCLDPPVSAPVEHAHSTRVVARAYHRLREELPEVDVQIVSAANTVYLLPTVVRSLRRTPRHRGSWRDTLRRANQATRPGSLLVDGRYAGDVVELGPGGVVAAVRELVTAAS